MKLKLVFSAEFIEDMGNISEDEICSEEEHKENLEEQLRFIAGKNAEIIIHEFKLKKMT